MAVRRIVANIRTEEVAAAHAFYGDLFGLRVAMDMGWIATFVSDVPGLPQLSVMTEGGSGAPAPDISIEVDDLDAVMDQVRTAGIAIVYGPADEPWGVRRFFVRDPFGRLINVLTHD